MKNYLRDIKILYVLLSDPFNDQEISAKLFFVYFNSFKTIVKCLSTIFVYVCT